MLDPLSLGLTAVGTLFSNYGKSRVDKAQRRDIKLADESWQKEYQKQKLYTGENESTVADTLSTYSRPASDARVANAVDVRDRLYTAPIMDKDFIYRAPGNFDANNIVANRNAGIGNTEKLKALSMAKSRANLDAYGDATTLGNILAARNAAKIGMVNRVAQGSREAEAQQQALLPIRMEADQNAGATWSTIGDWFKMGAGLSAGGGGANIISGQSGVPISGTQQWLARQGYPSWLNSGVSYTSPFAGQPANYGVYSQPLAALPGYGG